MLVFDFRIIGNKLLSFRKRAGMTQEEVAEKAGLSGRTYADIERGSVNMRIETILRICNALHITPDDVLTEEQLTSDIQMEAIIERLNACSSKNRETALKILDVYLESLS